MDRLNRDQIIEALETVASELDAADPGGELFVVGGAAMVLLYNARESTKDVDGFTTTPAFQTALRRAAARTAERLGLPSDWLNDGAKGFVRGFAPGALLVDFPRLKVRALAPAQLLAMKLSAWRDDVDIEDARLLLTQLVGDRPEIWAQIEPHLVPGRELKARNAFDDLREASHGAA